MISSYLKKKQIKDKEKVMKALNEQRGRYEETFELWNAKQLELELKRQDKAYERQQQRKVNPDAKRTPNKTDLYDKI